MADEVSVSQQLVERRVLRADPAYRRRFLIRYSLFSALLVLLSLAVYQWGAPILSQYIDRQKPAEAVRLLGLMMKASVLLTASLAVGVSAYMFRLGWRARTSGQLPSPGTRVLHDTPIVEGPAAVRQGTLMITLSVVLALIVVSGALAFVLLWDVSRLWPARAR